MWSPKSSRQHPSGTNFGFDFNDWCRCLPFQVKTKTRSSPLAGTRFLVAGRTGFEPATGFTQHSLSRRAHSATLAPPRIQLEGFKLPGAQLVLNKPSNIWTFYHAILSGGSGIRTHVGLHQTCFQDMHLQPLGHPSIGSRHFSGAEAILP